MSLAQRIRLGAWLLIHPTYHPILHTLVAQRIKSIINPNHYRQRLRSSEDWCARYAIGRAKALQQLTGRDECTSVYERFPVIFATARRVAERQAVDAGGAGDLELLYQLADHLRATRVLETGVGYGWSSLALLLSLQERPDARLISTDMAYPLSIDTTYVGCVVPDLLRDQWVLHREPDHVALPNALATMPELDLCHYDSDKTYEGRMRSYRMLWKSLREGGVFTSDDISDNYAFHDFCGLLQQRPTVVRSENKYVGILIK